MKIYQRGPETVVAACDAELIGQKFEEGEMMLHVSSFYDGFVVTERELLTNLEAATTANLVGKRTIKIAVKGGFIEKDFVIRIGGVPHAQLYKI